ncbi:hypothetical protein AS156_30880 [Bradyrhizobium macuxiense]|uniref:Uncharacterized protein n=1 Tax=Bradyrhizobium macuxiense TaxID=1755647 RepID=A0A109K2L1_9BRAD|nr:hypothetical protein AS156_30880 [Bradyrhizobium macuxiense]
MATLSPAFILARTAASGASIDVHVDCANRDDLELLPIGERQFKLCRECIGLPFATAAAVERFVNHGLVFIIIEPWCPFVGKIPYRLVGVGTVAIGDVD